MSDVVFITGASGVAGQELIRLYVTQTAAKLILLGRHTMTMNEQDVWLTSLLGYPSASGCQRITWVSGDVRQPGLGMQRSAQEDWQEQITQIIHCAAITQFDQPLEVVRRTNVLGTRHVLDFAQTCSRLQAFGHLSTLYVSGLRMGLIAETDLNNSYGFANTYEQSKYEAEQLVQAATTQLPITTYRLSTLLGNSRSGEVYHFTAPHQAIRLMYLGLASALPGKPNISVNLAPSDYSIETIFSLFTQHFTPGTVYHIAAPDRKCFNLQELIDTTYQVLGELDPVWLRKHLPRPSITDLATFDLLVRAAGKTGNQLLSHTLRTLRLFSRQLVYPKQFDMSHTISCLPRYLDNFPDIRLYYPEVIRYCLTTHWGKNVSH